MGVPTFSAGIFANIASLDRHFSRLCEVAKKIKNSELNDVVTSFKISLPYLKKMVERADLEEQRLRKEVNDKMLELAKVNGNRSKVELRGDHYYAIEPIPDYGSGPFCARCMDEHDRLSPFIMEECRIDKKWRSSLRCEKCNIGFILGDDEE